jgi:hypothetical protein
VYGLVKLQLLHLPQIILHGHSSVRTGPYCAPSISHPKIRLRDRRIKSVFSDKPKLPRRPFTLWCWKQQGSEECVFSNQYDSSVAQSNTAVDLKVSLRCIMAQCPDFQDEETVPRHWVTILVWQLTVVATPKFHAERAGEGIEYS